MTAALDVDGDPCDVPHEVLSAEVRCACGSATLRVLAHFANGPDVASRCWVAIDPDGMARPGCAPEERSAGLVLRRNLALERARNPRPLRLPYPPSAAVLCTCGRRTRVFFSNIEETTAPPPVPDPPDLRTPVASTMCWVAIEDDGTLVAGCSPDDRTTGLLQRRERYRNDQLAAAGRLPSRARHVYPRGAVIRCACGRRTRVHTSNIDCLVDAPACADPPDPAVPVSSTSCWLAIADDGGPAEGCVPDDRTYDVLERSRRGHRPAPEVRLEERPFLTIAPTSEDRERFEALRTAADAMPRATVEDPPPMLSLFDL